MDSSNLQIFNSLDLSDHKDLYFIILSSRSMQKSNEEVRESVSNFVHSSINEVKLDSIDELTENPSHPYNTVVNVRNTYRVNNSFKIKSKCKKYFISLIKNDIHLLLLIMAVISSTIIGIIANKSFQTLEEPTKSNLLLGIGFPGEIFLRLLRMAILPLIFSSLISGLAGMDKHTSKIAGKYAIIYYLSTTFLACLLGIGLVSLIRPGDFSTNTNSSRTISTVNVRTIDTFLDLIRSCITDNVVASPLEQMRTEADEIHIYYDELNITLPSDWDSINKEQWLKKNNYLKVIKEHQENNIKTAIIAKSETSYQLAGKTTYLRGINMLGIVFFCCIVGIILGRMGKDGQPIIKWVQSLDKCMNLILKNIMKLTSIGVFSLILSKFISMKNIADEFAALAMYSLTIIVGLSMHLLITIQLIYFIFTKKNPLIFLKNMTRAILTAFGTASSNATIPQTINCLEENNKIDKKVVRFMIPVGATINMDGTALYEAVAAIYIAQSIKVPLTIAQIFSISITATMASIGAAGMPQAGLVTMVIVLQTLNLPIDGIALILSVDWLLDRFRTVVNVLGDAYGCAIVDRLCSRSYNSTNKPINTV